MAVEQQLNLKSGKWLGVNCGSMPSESGCQMVMLAPEDQREDLVAAAVKHAVNKHGHEDNDELRQGIEKSIQPIDVA